LIYHVKNTTEIEGIRKQSAEDNIWNIKGMKWQKDGENGVMRSSIVVLITKYYRKDKEKKKGMEVHVLAR
jgi:hypothetical protein